MSNYWNLHCQDHDEAPDDSINHGADILRHLWSARHMIAKILHDSPGWLEIEIMGHGSHHTWFVVEHEDCNVELQDEYGSFEFPIKEYQKNE